MSVQHKGRRWGIAQLHRWITQSYSAIPYRYFPAGLALPSWHYYLEVTRRCNLRCAMCQYSEWFANTPASEQLANELSTDEWKRVIDQTGRFSLITFTGGEPWVRDDFMSLLEHACAKRRAHVITNATRLNDAVVRRCVELAPARLGGKGLNFLGASLEGPRNVHDGIRGLEGAFDTTMGSLRALAAYRKEQRKRCPIVHVTAVIQAGNVEALPELPAIVAEAGGDVLNLALEIRYLDLKSLGVVDPATIRPEEIALPRIDRGALESALEATAAAAVRHGIELRLPDMPPEHILDYYDGGIDIACYECRTAWTSLFVTSKGEAYTCLIRKVGDVRRQTLKAIWHNKEMRDWRTRIRAGIFPVCQGCCWASARKTGPHT